MYFRAALRDAEALLADWRGSRQVLLAGLEDANGVAGGFAFRTLVCLGQEDTLPAIDSAAAHLQDPDIAAMAESRRDLLDRMGEAGGPARRLPPLEAGFTVPFGPPPSTRTWNPWSWGLWRKVSSSRERFAPPALEAEE